MIYFNSGGVRRISVVIQNNNRLVNEYEMNMVTSVAVKAENNKTTLNIKITCIISS